MTNQYLCLAQVRSIFAGTNVTSTCTSGHVGYLQRSRYAVARIEHTAASLVVAPAHEYRSAQSKACYSSPTSLVDQIIHLKFGLRYRPFSFRYARIPDSVLTPAPVKTAQLPCARNSLTRSTAASSAGGVRGRAFWATTRIVGMLTFMMSVENRKQEAKRWRKRTFNSRHSLVSRCSLVRSLGCDWHALVALSL